MGVAIVAIAVGIILVMTGGPIPPDDASRSGTMPTISPVDVNVDSITTLNIDDESALLDISITLTNPNPNSVILSLVKYQIFADDSRVAVGQIGSRPGGMVDASNYYTILSGGSVTLTDTIRLDNMGGAPRFWAALESDTVLWTITGEAVFNLSSMTSGQENIVEFSQTI